MLFFVFSQNESALAKNNQVKSLAAISIQKSTASTESIGRLEHRLFGYKYNRRIDSTVVLKPNHAYRGIASEKKIVIHKGSKVITGEYTIKLKPEVKSKSQIQAQN